jgi:hypothetical protein
MLRTIIGSALICASLAWAAPPPAKPLAILRPTLHQYEDGPPVASSAGFATGESVFFSFELSGYQVSPESQVDLSSRMEALDPQGIPLVETMRQQIKTKVAPEDKNWVPIVRDSFLIPPLALPGDYRVTISVQDRLSSQSATAEIQFPVRGRKVETSDTLVARNVRFLRGEDDTQALIPPVYHPPCPVWVRFEIVGYKLGTQNRMQVSYGVTVLGPSGRAVYSEPQAAVEEGLSFYPKRYLPGTFSLNLNDTARPGQYTIVLGLHDEVGHQTVESRHEFTIQ